MIRSFVFCFFLVAGTSAFGSFKLGFTGCPDIPTQSDFDLTRYLGRWYEISKYPNWFEQGDCNGALYEAKDNGNVKVTNSEIRSGGKINTVVGEARVDPNGDAKSKLQVRFSQWQPWGDYQVLSTDYEGYTVVYSCTNFLVAKYELVWIMSRQRTLTPEVTQKIHDLLQKNNISVEPLQPANQDPEKCKALP